MNLTFHPFTQAHAEEIMDWKYPPPYEQYNTPDTDQPKPTELLTDSEDHFFAVIQDETMIAFRSFGKDGQVPGGSYPDTHLDTGGGLRPDLTGKGLGQEVITQGLLFGSRHFNTQKFRVSIDARNQRAQTVCRRIGFKKTNSFKKPLDGNEFITLTITLS